MKEKRQRRKLKKKASFKVLKEKENYIRKTNCH